MTGFGRGEAPLGDGRVVVEARSVNHRYLELRARVATELADHAAAVEHRARERVSRGRYDLVVRAEGPIPPPRLDRARARAALEDLRALRDEVAPGSDVPLTLLAGLPGLFAPPLPGEGGGAEAAIALALDRALEALDAMRRREGRTLAEELGARIGRCREVSRTIEQRVPLAVESHRARLRARVARLAADPELELSPGRLEAEVALLSERMDVTEELVRLGSHLDQLAELLGADGPVGRRLDFLLQEMAREANTIGAKSQDGELSRAVVELKAEVERLREQVQNVE